MEERVIEVIDLKKSYKSLVAVDNISFIVKKGELFSFLGTNGAGKSTTIDILCTLLEPDSGKVIINNHVTGKQDDAIKKDIGIVFQDSILDPILTVEENLKVRAKFYEKNSSKIKVSIRKAAKATGIEDILKRPYGKLSGGQRRRVDIARALLHAPKILFLDEPTTGLDPQTRKNIWNMISNLQKKHNMTVFLTTHYMEEAAKSDYIVILEKGKIIEKGTPLELKNRYATDYLKIETKHPEKLEEILQSYNKPIHEKNFVYQIPVTSPREAISILKEIETNIISFEMIHGNMDDVFLEITKDDNFLKVKEGVI